LVSDILITIFYNTIFILNDPDQNFIFYRGLLSFPWWPPDRSSPDGNTRVLSTHVCPKNNENQYF